MDRIASIFRFVILWIATGTPLMLIGLFFLGLRGFVAALVLVLLFLLGVSAYSEKIIVRLHRAVPALKGLQSSRRWASILSGVVVNEQLSVYTFADPAPNALVLGSLFRPAILISKGSIDVLSEEELRALLLLCQSRAAKPGLMVQTLCGVIAVFLLKAAPSAWTAMLFSGRSQVTKQKMNPLSFMAFLSVFPLVRLLALTGGVFRGQHAPEQVPALSVALRKAELFSGTWPLPASPGLDPLYLLTPWQRQSLLSLKI
jgi:hypothetical protein